MNLLGNSGSNINIREQVALYTKQWRWFVLSLVVILLFAFLYIRYTVPKYAAQAQLHILPDENSSADVSLFQDLGVFTEGGSSVEDEIQILTSRSNLTQAVKELGLNIKIESLGKILDTEIYENPPFRINFIEHDSVIYNSSLTFFLTIKSPTKYEYSEFEGEPGKVVDFGKQIETSLGDLVITPNQEKMSSYSDRDYKITIKSAGKVASSYKLNLVVGTMSEFSQIVNISLEDPVQKKAKHIIDKMIAIYNRNGVDDRKAIADKTSEFINNRIASIYENLSSADQIEEEFKSGKGITNIAAQSDIYLNVSAASNQRLNDVGVQLNIAESMKDYLDSQTGFEVLPSNIGLADPSIVNSVERYNQLALERQRLLKSSNEKNPIIVNLDQELEGLKRGMQSSLNGVTGNLSLEMNSLSKQLSTLNSRIYSAPRNERALRDISRKQQTTEQLYLYLLQKREESKIAYASAKPKSKVVDSAYSNSGTPVSPNQPIIYLASFVLGLLVPFSIIYVNNVLDNKVHSKADLEKFINDIPVIGELPRLGKKDSKKVEKEDRSVLAESLRIIRTNLDYILKTKESNRGNVILVTSSVPGEGKTFFSSNLSSILGYAGKKVVLVGADIRNPRLYTFFDMETDNENTIFKKTPERKKRIGLTDYLSDEKLEIDALIHHSLDLKDRNVDIIYSGKIPPNPAELLINSRVKELFKELSDKYDYVIVDSAPLMVVTDTVILSEHARKVIYVVKAGSTDKEVLNFPLNLKKDGKLNDLSFVVNSVKDSELGYGGKYGYGYGREKKKWWKLGA